MDIGTGVEVMIPLDEFKSNHDLLRCVYLSQGHCDTHAPRIVADE